MASLSHAASDLDSSTTGLTGGSSSVATMMSNGGPYDPNQAHAGAPAADQQQQQLLQQAGQQQQQQLGGMLTPASQPSSSSQARSVKRPRPVKSCTECRKRKLKCDRSCPCSQCTKSHRSCKYAADQDPANLSDTSDVEMAEPGRVTKKPFLGTSTTSSTTGAGGSAAGAGGGGSGSVRDASSNNNGPAPAPSSQSVATADHMVTTPSKNSEHTPAPSSSLTLEGVAQRLEMLEKLVNAKPPHQRPESARPKPQIQTPPPNTVRQLSVKDGAARTRFFGQNSTRVLIDLFPEAKYYYENPEHVDGLADSLHKLRALRKLLQARRRNSIAPITVYVNSIMPVVKRMKDILPPNKATCDRLLSAYIDTNETLYRMVHVPTFREKYERYWAGTLNSESFLPQLLAVLAIGTRFATKHKGLGNDGDGVHIPTACKQIRDWLNGVNGKQLVEFSTLQTEVLLLHAHRVMSLERAQESWVTLGKIVRMAMTMGLQRDPAECGKISVFDGEMRRRLWFTLLDMDLQISLVVNLPCVIRDGDFTCKPPQNLDDAELYEDMVELPPGHPIEQTTQSQIQVYATNTLPPRLKAANLVHRVDSISDYHEVIHVGQKLDQYIEDINYIFPRHGLTNHGDKSRQWRWRVIMDMHVRRPLLALYRPLALGAPGVPSEIIQTYLRSCMVILRYLDELDPNLPHYREVGDMYLQILRPDIIMSCFSICYYIQDSLNRGGIERNSALFGGGSDPQMTFASDGILLGTPTRLINTVQKSINLLIQYQGPGDLSDIVPLYLVFQSVRRNVAAAAVNATASGVSSNGEDFAAAQHEDLASSVRKLLETSLEVTQVGELELEPLLAPRPPSLSSDDGSKGDTPGQRYPPTDHTSIGTNYPSRFRTPSVTNGAGGAGAGTPGMGNAVPGQPWTREPWME